MKTRAKTAVQNYKNKQKTLYQIKAKQEKIMIQQTLQQIQNRIAYEYLIKMGEANELSQKLGYKKTYRVFNSADNSIKCDLYQGNMLLKTLNADEFQRELKSLRKDFFKSRNLKFWETANIKPEKLIYTEINQKPFEKQKEDLNKIKNTRQLILRECLENTISLAKTLKQQVQILQKKGVNQIVLDNNLQLHN